MDRRQSAALDRHITGNYGEDQLAESCPECGSANVRIAFLPASFGLPDTSYMVCDDCSATWGEE